jgi:hypothetical protein
MGDSLIGGGLITSSAADALAAFSFPADNFVASALGRGLQALNQRRIEEARRIALASISKGNSRPLEVAEADEFVAIVHRYMRAAVEGTATINLRLMANVIAGQILEKSLHASDFQQYANIVSTLSRAEIVYLGTMARLVRDGIPKSPMDNFHSTEVAVSTVMSRELVPSTHFQTPEEYLACETALQRTGLVYRRHGSLDGGPEILALSPSGHALSRLARFEQVMVESI